MPLKVAVVGAKGYVGKSMMQLFEKCQPVAFDLGLGTTDEVNACDVALVCVPTPMKADGSCDTSIVFDVVSWLRTPLIVIRSTIPPGTTDRLEAEHKVNVVFCPEYVGSSSVAHPLNDNRLRSFLILGGRPTCTETALQAFQQVYNASVKVMRCTAKEAEVIKYTENSFIATYVTFCNEFAQVAKTFDVSWSTVREGFLLDPRMTPYWTFVYPENPGFGGHCLPKDLNAIVAASRAAGYNAEFLESVLAQNERIKKISQ